MQVTVLSKTRKPEKLVCQAARGCYSDSFVGETEYAELMEPISGETLEDKERTLIEQLLRRGHYGPFEHAQITFAVEGVSRSLMAQITRHRFMTFDVQSQRYVNFSDVGIVTPKSLQDEDHFTRETGLVDVDSGRRAVLYSKFKYLHRQCVDLYEQMVDAGIPKEDARFILPIGTPVNMTFSGNARTMLHVLDMRRKADAQWEVRELSNLLLAELQEWMPVTFAYYEKNGPNRLSP